jgi:hypothetical protein
MMFKEQAEQCRRQASEFAGRPEAPFLLSVACAFDDLAIEADARLTTRPDRAAMLEAAPPMTA